MDVDPTASAAHSHMLKSQRNKGRSEVVRVGANNLGLNTSKNMFNRLGRGTDMKKTLNRRREQERSQYSIIQRARSEANSQGIKNILLEDLRWAVIAIEEQDDE